MTSESLWSYYRHEVNDSAIEIHNDGNKINKDKTITNESLEYKRKKWGNTPHDSNTLNAEVVVLLKYLSKFWKFLDLPLINYETELDLSWSKECIISEMSITPKYLSLIAVSFGNTKDYMIENLKTMQND